MYELEEKATVNLMQLDFKTTFTIYIYMLSMRHSRAEQSEGVVTGAIDIYVREKLCVCITIYTIPYMRYILVLIYSNVRMHVHEHASSVCPYNQPMFR